MQLVKRTLEKMLGEERFERVKDSRAYKFGVEAFSMNTFSYATAMPIELCVAGMDLSEHLYTRLAAVATNTLTGRPYGIWRDWLFKKMNIKENSHWAKKYAGDTLAFMGFQLPLYWINMAIGGAEVDEMAKASIPVTLMSGALGGPYGLYLDKVRKACDIPSRYLSEEKKEEIPAS